MTSRQAAGRGSAQPAQNSPRTARRRGPGRPFPPGRSGNPGGRPRGLVRAIRELTADGEELVAFMVGVLRDEVPGVRLRDRMAAAAWLADRGFGRPVEAVEHSGEPIDVGGFARPTLADFHAAVRLHEARLRAEAEAAGGVGNGDGGGAAGG